MGRQSLRGSVTVEASLLMPFLVWLIWNILYLAFFVYNQSTILQGNYCTALRTERYCASAEERRVLSEEKYKVSVLEKLVCAGSTKEIEITEKEIIVTTELTMHAPGGRFYDSIWSGQQRQKADVWKPVAFIRLCRSAENAMDRMRGEE